MLCGKSKNSDKLGKKPIKLNVCVMIVDGGKHQVNKNVFQYENGFNYFSLLCQSSILLNSAQTTAYSIYLFFKFYYKQTGILLVLNHRQIVICVSRWDSKIFS